AVEAMAVRGEIRLATADVAGPAGGKAVEITVANTGSYIPPERMERLFEGFATSGKTGGTGLGLAIARRIMVAHGGTIRCSSFIVDGTCFHMIFPAALAP